MQNLTISQWIQLIDYLEGREEFLCNGEHTIEYLENWSEFYDSSKEIQKFFTKKMNVHCDCSALEIGRKKMSKINETKPQASTVT